MKNFFITCFKRNVGVIIATAGLLSAAPYFSPIEPVDSNFVVCCVFIVLFAATMLTNCYVYLAEKSYNEMHWKAKELHYLNSILETCQGIFLVFAILFLYKQYLDFLNPFLFYREIPVILVPAALMILCGSILTIEATVS